MVVKMPTLLAATNVRKSSYVVLASASTSAQLVSSAAILTREQRDLDAEFEFWAAESQDIAAAAFAIQSQAVVDHS